MSCNLVVICCIIKADFIDILFLDFTTRLSNYIKINNYIIELVYSKPLIFKSIYDLGLVEFKTLKNYLKINLANYFI